MLNKLVIGGVQSAVTYNICCSEGHVSNACPNLQGGNVNVEFPNQGQRKYDPCSNTYNKGWRDHPNIRYSPKPNPPDFNQLSNQSSTQDKTDFLLEQMMKKMDEHKKETDLKLQNLEMSMKHMQEKQSASDTLVSNLQAQVQQRIPSQPYSNPKDNVNAITLRSGQELKEPKWSKQLESKTKLRLRNLEMTKRRSQPLFLNMNYQNQCHLFLVG